VAVLLAIAHPVPGSPAPASAAPALARLSFVERRADLQGAAGSRPATEGSAVRLGDRVRTEVDAVARLELPWMTITMGPASEVRFAGDYLLAAVLEHGRLQLLADKGPILKLVTEEAEVHGQGWAVVRRAGRVTLVSVLRGRFFVQGAGRTIALAPGTGAVVRAGVPPAGPLALPEPPHGLSPGSDPRYAAPGEALSLSWASPREAHQVEVLPVGSDDVLIQRDVGAPPWSLAIPWRGAFRWRVSARDASGLEGPPSTEGLISVDR